MPLQPMRREEVSVLNEPLKLEQLVLSQKRNESLKQCFEEARKSLGERNKYQLLDSGGE